MICQEPEGPIFRKAMQAQGWQPEHFEVWKEGRFAEPDYFRFGFPSNANAFNSPIIEFWPESLDTHNTVLVGGWCGGEIFDYPIAKKMFGYPHDNRLDDLLHFYKDYIPDLAQYSITFKDLLMPYLSYEYLETAFKVPAEHFKYIKVNGQKVDQMRGLMWQYFKDPVPVFQGHEYNLAISSRTVERIKADWFTSKLYKRFRVNPLVKNAEPWTVYQRANPIEIRNSVDCKFYGLATCYEHVD